MAVVLVVVGTTYAGIVPTWRGAILGLGLQYLGVAIILVATSGPGVGLVAIVTAIGIEAIVASGQGITLRDRGWLANPLSVGDLASNQMLAVDPDRPRRRMRPRAGFAALPFRWFDLSVIALAIVGALGIAVGRGTFGSFGANAIVGVLILTGLLYCLLGGSARLMSGLLFLGSAVNVLLHATGGAAVSSVELLLVAASQVALALALVFVRAIDLRLDGTNGRIADAKAPTDSSEPALASADVDVLT
jgi:hypothetical protein